jgi:hypothetical protein
MKNLIILYGEFLLKKASHLWSKKRDFGLESHKEINIPVYRGGLAI